MSGHFDLLVFDWDGTLADTVEHIVTAMVQAIARAGLEPRTPSRIRGIIGLGMHEAVATLYPGLPASHRDRLAQAYRDCYHMRAAAGVALFPGVAVALGVLRERGHRLAVATGKGRQGLHGALRATGMEGMFDATRTADETASKPAPDMLHELMAMLDVSPERTLMIGDSEHDLRMAANAGVSSVAVLTGVRDARGLLEFSPLACIGSVAELPAWLAARGVPPSTRPQAPVPHP
jgi:phosphoglycolate phosphatase